MKSSGLGAAADARTVTKTTEASVGAGATVNAARHILVEAESEERSLSIVAGVAVAAKGDLAVAGSLSVLTLTTTTKAFVDNGALLHAGGNVIVSALGEAQMLPAAGQVSVGTGTLGFGASNTTIIHTDTVTAFVGDADVTALGGGGTSEVYNGERDGLTPETDSVTGLSVTAVSFEDILSAAIGGTFGGKVGIAGSATVNVLVETTTAYIDDGARVNADGVNVLASDDTLLVGLAGGLAIGGKGGVGAGVDVGSLVKTTEAYLGSGVEVNAEGDVLVRAEAEEVIFSISAAAGIGGTVGLAGAAGVQALVLVTRAVIGEDDKVKARGSVVVSADSDTETYQFDGQVSGSGIATIGARRAVLDAHHGSLHRRQRRRGRLRAAAAGDGPRRAF